MADLHSARHVAGGAVEQAAAAFDVAGLVDGRLRNGDPVRELQLAAAVAGAADAAAMLAATALAARTPHDPMPLVDEVAFRASGREGSGVRPTSALWAIWNLRRTQARLGTMLRREAAPELAAASALLDAAYALLSGHAHGRLGGRGDREECLARAREVYGSAGQIIDGLAQDLPGA